MRQATAVAHPNIALVKYWGKQPGPGNRPATPSLSITLDALTTTTTVREAEADAVTLNGARVEDAKIGTFLQTLRERYIVPPIAIDSANDFPTGSGLASSASGFAALVTAINRAFELNMTDLQRSTWSRQGSGSAARSIFGGYATLSEVDGDWVGQPLMEAAEWPLNVVVGIASLAEKSVGSTKGMELSRTTSPYYEGWVKSTTDDFDSARAAVEAKDFDTLAAIAEHSCLKLHALMLSTVPGLIYWNGATVEAIHRIRALAKDGVKVFFTIDAGAQIKAVCTPDDCETVRAELADVPGIERTMVSALGPGAQ